MFDEQMELKNDKHDKTRTLIFILEFVLRSKSRHKR